MLAVETWEWDLMDLLLLLRRAWERSLMADNIAPNGDLSRHAPQPNNAHRINR